MANTTTPSRRRIITQPTTNTSSSSTPSSSSSSLLSSPTTSKIRDGGGGKRVGDSSSSSSSGVGVGVGVISGGGKKKSLLPLSSTKSKTSSSSSSFPPPPIIIPPMNKNKNKKKNAFSESIGGSRYVTIILVNILLLITFLFVTFGPAFYFHYLDERVDKEEFSPRNILFHLNKHTPEELILQHNNNKLRRHSLLLHHDDEHSSSSSSSERIVVVKDEEGKEDAYVGGGGGGNNKRIRMVLPTNVQTLNSLGLNIAGNPTFFHYKYQHGKNYTADVTVDMSGTYGWHLRRGGNYGGDGGGGGDDAGVVVKKNDVVIVSSNNSINVTKQKIQQQKQGKKKPFPEVINMEILNQELKFDNPDGGAWKQGWNVQPTQSNITVFVVPHSHNDPGWIKTFDEYFKTQTRNILTSVYKSLMKDKRRTFIWAEISYFEWWWKEQGDKVRSDMVQLIKNKQFEFVTGGWVMPDEANSVRFAIEIQLQEGHDWLKSTFGRYADASANGDVNEDWIIPKYGWSIDPFGYSPTMAAVLKDYGFEGMLIQRVHYAIKKEFAKKKTLEFMWRQNWDDNDEDSNDDSNSGGGRRRWKNDIFTHVMPFYSYDVPHTCGPDPSVCCQFDFARLGNKYGGCPWKKPPKEITDQNVKERSEKLIDQYRKKANLYKTNVVLAPLGDDFRYQTLQEAELQYTNYQKIFDYVNANMHNVNIQFGTLSDYFTMVQNEIIRTNIQIPILKGSFFTYADRDEDYWSGYFTSRIFDKALDRRLEAVLYAAMTLGATKDEMKDARRALSLFQHHDGVTGTAKNHVVMDYAKRMFDSINFVLYWIADHLDYTVINDNNGDDHAIAAIHGGVGGGGGGGVVRKNETTMSNNNNNRRPKIEPCWIQNEPRKMGSNLCDPDKPIYLYNPLNTPQKWCDGEYIARRETKKVNMMCNNNRRHNFMKKKQKQQQLQFDSKTGMVIHPFKEEWMIWQVTKGGAYLFFPHSLRTVSSSPDDLIIENGGYKVHTTNNNWSRKVVEYDNGVFDFFYYTNLQQINNEWFVRFTSPNLQNQGIFHTDLNGFNFDTHYYRSDLPIQAQVYPMPTLASIQDDNTRFTIISEHSQGTASIKNGSIDIFLDRKLNQDDARGLGQGVKDNVPIQSRLRIVIEKNDSFDRSSSGNNDDDNFKLTSWCQQMWDEVNHPPEVFGTHLLKQFSDKNKNKNGQSSSSSSSSSLSSSSVVNTLNEKKRIQQQQQGGGKTSARGRRGGGGGSVMNEILMMEEEKQYEKEKKTRMMQIMTKEREEKQQEEEEEDKENVVIKENKEKKNNNNNNNDNYDDSSKKSSILLAQKMKRQMEIRKQKQQQQQQLKHHDQKQQQQQQLKHHGHGHGDHDQQQQ